MTSPDLLTVAECAKVLRCHKHQVYALIKEGKIEAFRISRKFLISNSSFQAYLPDGVS